MKTDAPLETLETAAKKRGRPPTGTAMTPAERQRAYRDRKRSRLAALQDPAQPVTSTIIDLSELPPAWHQGKRARLD